MSTSNRPLLLFVAITFAFAVYTNIALLRTGDPLLPLPFSQSVAVTFSMTLFAVAHAILLLGNRTTAVFFAIAAVVSWLLEHFGVATGAIYGPYHYGDALGAKLGHVPILIPLAWFMMIYPSYVIANLIVDGRPHVIGGGAGAILWRALIAAMVMTAWDIVIDPGMAAEGIWVWENGGPYFGVPLRNFAGWIATTFAVYTLFGFAATRMRTLGAQLSRGWIALPVLAYAMLTLRYVLYNERGVLGVVALFAMGFPALVAFGNALSERRRPAG